jgi:hypothetical protein
VIVSNVNDNIPSIDDSTGSIAEDANSGAVVTVISGSDADGDPISYSIVAGNNDGVFGVSGDQLLVVDSTNLDFEMVNSYVLTVSGSDGLLADTGIVTVIIHNTNDNIPLIDDLSWSVPETIASGSIVTTVS